MSDFVHFSAKGYIYATNKDGKKVKGNIIGTRKGTGITRKGPDMMGRIFRQVPYLTPCDAVVFETEDI